jgi:hypothetical protein
MDTLITTIDWNDRSTLEIPTLQQVMVASTWDAIVNAACLGRVTGSVGAKTEVDGVRYEIRGRRDVGPAPWFIPFTTDLWDVYLVTEDAAEKTGVNMDAYTTTEHQVWVQPSGGGFFAYRTDLVASVAHNWAKAWNEQPPSEHPGATFHVVKATTTYSLDD